MKCFIFKKLFYVIAGAFIATASFQSLSAMSINGSRAQMAMLREARNLDPQAFSFDQAHSSSYYIDDVPTKPTTTMIPSNRELISRTARTPLIPRTENLDQQAEIPAYAQKQTPTSRSSEVPAIPLQQPLDKKPLTEGQSVLKSLLSPFAYASSTLRAMNPLTYIENSIMKCVRGATTFFVGKSIEPEMEQMIMPVLHMGIGMAVKPVINYFVTPQNTEYITKFFIQGGTDLAGNITESTTIKRSSRFIGTFLTEYFMNKASCAFNKNIYSLQRTYEDAEGETKEAFDQTGINFSNKDELLCDTQIARMIILTGNVVHLLGDLHNILFTPQMRGNDALDRYIKMSESVINLADYCLYTYKNTTKSAQSEEMQKYFETTLNYIQIIKAVHAQISDFKKQTDASGMTPMLNMILGITPSLEKLQPDAEMLAGQMNPFAQMMAMGGQQ